MKIRSPLKNLAAAVLTASTMLGCSAQGPGSAPRPEVVAREIHSPVFRVLVSEDEFTKYRAEFMQELNLTPAQKQQLKGVVNHALELSKPMVEMLRPLLTSAEVDSGAITSGMEKLLQMDAAQDAQTMDEIRAVLTVKQRQVVADALNRFAAQVDLAKLVDKLNREATEKLDLDAQRQEKFARFTGDFLGFWQENQDAYLAAMTKHMLQGGKQELQETFERLNQALKPDSAVAFLASLDPSQRQAVVESIDTVRDQIAEAL